MLQHYNNTGRLNYVFERCLHVTVFLHTFNEHIDLCKQHKIQRMLVPEINDSGSKEKLCYSPSTSESNIAHFEADLPFFSTADF